MKASGDDRRSRDTKYRIRGVLFAGLAGILVVEFNQVALTFKIGTGYLPVWLVFNLFVGMTIGTVAGLVAYSVNRLTFRITGKAGAGTIIGAAVIGTIAFEALWIVVLKGFQGVSMLQWIADVAISAILLGGTFAFWRPGTPIKAIAHTTTGQQDHCAKRHDE